MISADVGAPATLEIIDNLKDESKRKALPDAKAVISLLSERIAEQFAHDKKGILTGDKAVILFVGINGTGKTTTVGKIAKEATDLGVSVILGSADTFRAAAIEQLEVWAQRANVEMVTRERGSDPASVCYATIERAEELDTDLVLIDTAGRLHTSKDLMAELEKVVNVTRKRSKLPVYVILVIDATTGQNGLTQAKEFNEFLDLDGLIVTKLDGTAKGGIALAISKELDLPILKIGVGEKIEDLRNFNAEDFAKAFIGEEPEPEPEPESEPEPIPEPDPEPESVPEPEPEPVVEEDSGSEVQDEITEVPAEEEQEDEVVEIEEQAPTPEPEPEIEEVPEAKEEPEPEPVPEPEPEPEPEIEEEPKKKKGKLRGLFKKLFSD